MDAGLTTAEVELAANPAMHRKTLTATLVSRPRRKIINAIVGAHELIARKGRELSKAWSTHLAPTCAMIAVASLPNVASAQSLYPVYGKVKSPLYVQVQENVRSQRLLEGLAGELSKGIALPKPVALVLQECGQANAFYSSAARAVVLCYELIREMGDGIGRDHAKYALPEEINKEIAGGIAFILLHELGHALIRQLDLPILGREEDAADQIAAYVLLNQKEIAKEGLAAALWFFRSKTIFYTRQHFSDEHSLNPVRQSNLACWAYGKDANGYSYLMAGGFLTTARAPRCKDEYARLSSSVQRLLGEKLRF